MSRFSPRAIMDVMAHMVRCRACDRVMDLHEESKFVSSRGHDGTMEYMCIGCAAGIPGASWPEVERALFPLTVGDERDIAAAEAKRLRRQAKRLARVRST